MTRQSWIAALVWLLLMALTAFPAQAQTFPKLTGRVVDAANIIPDDQETQLSAELAALEKQNGQQFVIATIPSLEGRTIEDYGYRLGRSWGIGRKEVNDGVILIIAPNERQVRIEVGYGLTPILTSGLTGLIVERQILPHFKAGDLPGGIRAGADAVLAQLRLPAPEAEARAQRILAEQARQGGADMRANSDGENLMFLVWIAFILILLFSAWRAKGGRRYRRGSGPVVIWDPPSSGWGSGSSGGSSGGGGFSGGGGSFGGGGASGSW